VTDDWNPWARSSRPLWWASHESALIADPDAGASKAIVYKQLGDQFYPKRGKVREPELPRLVVLPGFQRGSAMVVDVETQQVVAGPMSVGEACVMATRRVR
jgi:hypothetical protein